MGPSLKASRGLAECSYSPRMHVVGVVWDVIAASGRSYSPRKHIVGGVLQRRIASGALPSSFDAIYMQGCGSSKWSTD